MRRALPILALSILATFTTALAQNHGYVALFTAFKAGQTVLWEKDRYYLACQERYEQMKAPGVMNGLVASSLQSDSIEVAPNPTFGVITMRLELWEDRVNIDIFNELGERMMTLNEEIYPSRDLSSPFFYRREIDLSLLPPGVYLMWVRSGNRTWIQKVVKL